MNDPIWPVFEVIRYFINVMLMIRSNIDCFFFFFFFFFFWGGGGLFVCFVCLFLVFCLFVFVSLFVCFLFFFFVCLFLFFFVVFSTSKETKLRIYPTELQLNKYKSGTFFGFESMYIKWYSFHQNL